MQKLSEQIYPECEIIKNVKMHLSSRKIMQDNQSFFMRKQLTKDHFKHTE